MDAATQTTWTTNSRMERDIYRASHEVREGNGGEKEKLILPLKKRKMVEPRTFKRHKKEKKSVEGGEKYPWMRGEEIPLSTILSYEDGTQVRYEDVPLNVREHFSPSFKKNGKGNYKHVYKYCGRKKGKEESGEETGYQVILTGEESQTLVARVADAELGALIISTRDERVLSSKGSAHNWVLWMIKLGEKALEEYTQEEKEKEN